MRGIVLVLLWCSCFAVYANTTPPADLASIPLVNIAASLALSFIGGLAWSSQKEAASPVENKKLKLTIFADILNSMVAGLITYFAMAAATDSRMAQAAMITIAGYGGTRVLETYLGGFMERVKTFFAGAPKV